jgi:hypothetical protein
VSRARDLWLREQLVRQAPVHQDLARPVLDLIHREDLGREVLVDDERLHLLVGPGQRSEHDLYLGPPRHELGVAELVERRVRVGRQRVPVVCDVRGYRHEARRGGRRTRGRRDRDQIASD